MNEAKGIEGIKEVTKNMDIASGNIMRAMLAGMDVSLRDIVGHVKTEYSRPRTGKGFTDRTGNLRNSISHKQGIEGDEVVGYVYAGMDYAGHVELRYEGQYAYLWPGVNDKSDSVKERIRKAVGAVTGR